MKSDSEDDGKNGGDKDEKVKKSFVKEGDDVDFDNKVLRKYQLDRL